MDCYHCQSRAATLKCEGCDSNIFRFCSERCGAEAVNEHASVCYDRNNTRQLEQHLYRAIAEMQDREDIDDAMEVAVDLKGDGRHDGDVVKEAHEIIQAHLEEQGYVRIEVMTDTEKAEEAARKAAAAEESARKRQERLDELERARLARGDKAMTAAEKRAARNMRRAQRAAKRKERAEKRAQRALARGERAKARTQKPGLRERWHAWRKGHDEKRAAKQKDRAKVYLSSSDDESK